MASTTLTLPAAMASPAAGTILALDLAPPPAGRCARRAAASSAARCHSARADTTAAASATCASAPGSTAWPQDAAGIGVVHYEEVRRHLSTDAAHVHGGLLATLTAWCEQRSIAYQGVPVGTIKRFIAGKGNADKAAVIAAIRARGFAPADDNEADASPSCCGRSRPREACDDADSVFPIAALPRPSSSSTAARASW